MKRTVLVFNPNGQMRARIKTYLPDELVKAYKAISLYAFVLPNCLEDQAY